MNYLLLLFQLVWFYVPFVYWIVNGVYFPPVCCTFFVTRIHERINLFTMKNLKFLLPFQERLDTWMEKLYSLLGLKAMDMRLFKMVMWFIIWSKWVWVARHVGPTQ